MSNSSWKYLIQWNANTIRRNGQTCKGIQNSIAHTKVCLNFLSEKIHTLLSCKCIVQWRALLLKIKSIFFISDLNFEATPPMSLPYVDPIRPPPCLSYKPVLALSSNKLGPILWCQKLIQIQSSLRLDEFYT